MPISETGKLIIKIKDEFGIELDPIKRYTIPQLTELVDILSAKKERFLSVATKKINETTNSCIGGGIEPGMLKDLVEDLLKI